MPKRERPVLHQPNLHSERPPPECCEPPPRSPASFNRTVDRIPHLVEHWNEHRMRYQWQALRQFIADWKSFPQYRERMLAKPLSGPDNDPHLAYIAATVHALCLRDGWPVPNWVHRFVAEELFLGQYPKKMWYSDHPAIAAIKENLHPVGEKHNVVLERSTCG